ncbi:MAG: L,D-transpeptidase [Bacteroidales bacterium]|nr:L,D-transpeptidase [Bacteroidales bacterium]
MSDKGVNIPVPMGIKNLAERIREIIRIRINFLISKIKNIKIPLAYIRYAESGLLPALITVVSFILVFMVPPMQEFTIRRYNPLYSDTLTLNPHEKEAAIESISKSVKSLQKKLSSFAPKQAFLVVNTTLNEFRLYRGSKLIREGKCSTGSYIRLEDDNNQQWFFRTPKGKFSIQGKTTRPVWRKPDWAFVEEGVDVPPANHPSRYEKGVLGDYALSLGDGYLIHGTLYKRYLGLPVTHGCIRMNDEDLETVYNHLQTSSRVFIY